MCTSKPQTAKAAEKDRQKGITVTDANGYQYYVLGKTRIKITEHFIDNGKSIDNLLSDLIQAKIKEEITKTA